MMANDSIIARGLDKWLTKYGWYDGGKTMEQRLKDILYVSMFVHDVYVQFPNGTNTWTSTHRSLEDRTGIFTFVGIGRKETTPSLSIQTYLTSELYILRVFSDVLRSTKPKRCLFSKQTAAVLVRLMPGDTWRLRCSSWF
jgi:hypothetical protein